MRWNQVPIFMNQVSFTDQNISIFEDLTLEFNPASVTVLLGGSGCGKSTVLKAAAGLIPITSGSVKYGENSIYGLNQKEYARMQQHTGFMFQDSALWANKNIQENLSLPLQIADPKADADDVEARVVEVLEQFSMVSYMNSRPSGLSAGERKIVSFLRAVITEPDILFLDEPTTFIDRESVLKLIKSLFRFKEEGKTILMVTHDMNLAKSLGDYLVFLHEGKPVLYDTVENCMTSDNLLWRNFLADRITHISKELDTPEEREHSMKQEEYK